MVDHGGPVCNVHKEKFWQIQKQPSLMEVLAMDPLPSVARKKTATQALAVQVPDAFLGQFAQNQQTSAPTPKHRHGSGLRLGLCHRPGKIFEKKTGKETWLVQMAWERQLRTSLFLLRTANVGSQERGMSAIWRCLPASGTLAHKLKNQLHMSGSSGQTLRSLICSNHLHKREIVTLLAMLRSLRAGSVCRQSPANTGNKISSYD